jgi:hypothetical protein
MRLDKVQTAQVLRLTQGAVTSPDREVLVYLNLKPGEKLDNQSLTVTKETKGNEVSQVIKRWKDNAGAQPTLKAFPTGYSLKLEFGTPNNNTLPGKIFLALPDPEQTVVAGKFEAALAAK